MVEQWSFRFCWDIQVYVLFLTPAFLNIHLFYLCHEMVQKKQIAHLKVPVKYISM